MMLSTQLANASSSLLIVDVASVTVEPVCAGQTCEFVVVSDSNPSSRSQLDGEPVFDDAAVDAFQTDVAFEPASAPATSASQAGRSLPTSLFCGFFAFADITALSSSRLFLYISDSRLNRSFIASTRDSAGADATSGCVAVESLLLVDTELSGSVTRCPTSSRALGCNSQQSRLSTGSGDTPFQPCNFQRRGSVDERNVNLANVCARSSCGRSSSWSSSSSLSSMRADSLAVAVTNCWRCCLRGDVAAVALRNASVPPRRLSNGHAELFS